MVEYPFECTFITDGFKVEFLFHSVNEEKEVQLSVKLSSLPGWKEYNVESRAVFYSVLYLRRLTIYLEAHFARMAQGNYDDAPFGFALLQNEFLLRPLSGDVYEGGGSFTVQVFVDFGGRGDQRHAFVGIESSVDLDEMKRFLLTYKAAISAISESFWPIGANTMSDRKTQIIKELDEARAKFKSLASKLTPQHWETPVQDADERWTPHQILFHLTDAQRGMRGQMTRISSGQDGVPADFDLNRWNVRMVQKNAEKPVPDLLVELDEGHVALIQLLYDLSDADLDKRGRHSSLEIMSVEEIARLIASHEIEHTQIIAAGLGLSA